MQADLITEYEFEQIRLFFQRETGIALADSKRSLVCGRLNSRLRELQLTDFASYLDYLRQPTQHAERQMAVDLLTTNETYFYRESKHFTFLSTMLAGWPGERPPLIWSAACSSGEEPYTLAMLMAEQFGRKPWRLLASDISLRMLETARTALYPMSRARELPTALLKKYCLKGRGDYEGYLLVDDSVRHRVTFSQRNLMDQQELDEKADVIFLRNVLIYFDSNAKAKIVANLTRCLKPGGLLFIGHSESLHGVTACYEQICPALYRLKGVA